MIFRCYLNHDLKRGDWESWPWQMMRHQFLRWSLIWDAADSVIVLKKLHAPLRDDDQAQKYDNDDKDYDADYEDGVVLRMDRA